MNFLQLCNLAWERCGKSAARLTTVVDRTGEAGAMVNLVQEAWLEIQRDSDHWKFMRARFSFQTQVSKSDYTPTEAGVTDLSTWDFDSLRSFKTSLGKADDGYLVPWDYDVFLDTYDFGAQTPGRPTVFAIRDEDRALVLGPSPDAIYTVYGYYRRAPRRLEADNEAVPAFNEKWHWAIVYSVMMKWGAQKNAGETFTEGMNLYNALMEQMRAVELPAISTSGPLA